MEINYKDINEIFSSVLNSLDDGIIVLNEQKEIFIINGTAIHLLSNNEFKISGNKLRIRNNVQGKNTSIGKNKDVLAEYFKIYPTMEDVLISIIAKDEMKMSTKFYRKVLKMKATGKTYYVIIIKAKQ